MRLLLKMLSIFGNLILAESAKHKCLCVCIYIYKHIKRVGGIGHPCFTPWYVISDLELTDRFVSMQMVVPLYISSVLIQCSGCPLFLILSYSLFLSILLNAFM
jgi:hypothetical protein